MPRFQLKRTLKHKLFIDFLLIEISIWNGKFFIPKLCSKRIWPEPTNLFIFWVIISLVEARISTNRDCRNLYVALDIIYILHNLFTYIISFRRILSSSKVYFRRKSFKLIDFYTIYRGTKFFSIFKYKIKPDYCGIYCISLGK